MKKSVTSDQNASHTGSFERAGPTQQAFTFPHYSGIFNSVWQVLHMSLLTQLKEEGHLRLTVLLVPTLRTVWSFDAISLWNPSSFPKFLT